MKKELTNARVQRTILYSVPPALVHLSDQIGSPAKYQRISDCLSAIGEKCHPRSTSEEFIVNACSLVFPCRKFIFNFFALWTDKRSVDHHKMIKKTCFPQSCDLIIAENIFVIWWKMQIKTLPRNSIRFMRVEKTRICLTNSTSINYYLSSNCGIW